MRRASRNGLTAICATLADTLMTLILVVSLVAAATAAIVGFGIGSLLTPLLALRYDMALAVALVSVPHAVATALRCWRLRRDINWQVLARFGLLSAAGLVSSKSEGRRLIQGGGVRLDGEKVESVDLTIDPPADPRILQVGKRKWLRLEKESQA